MITMEEYQLAEDFWRECGEGALEALEKCCFPLYTCSDTVPDGISICEVCYKSKKEKTRTRWLENRPLKKGHQLMVKCQWSFRPILISPGRKSVSPEDLRYWYMMYVKQDDVQGNSISYRAKIITGMDGTQFKREILDPFPKTKNEKAEQRESRRNSLKLRFAFPKRLVSKMNRCLSNYFLPHLWAGPPWAVWHRAEGKVAYYLGVSEGSEMLPSFLPSLLNLINGPSGGAASVLLAYSCFSILKSFFPSFHRLSKKTTYVDARKSIPKQIAINIQSSNAVYAEKLAEISCGYFCELRKNRAPIIDGILVQKCPSKLKQLGRNEFETTILNPACILWVNREPIKELTQGGEILNLDMKTWQENSLDSSFSQAVVNLITCAVSKWSKSAYEKFWGTMWESSKPCIEKYLIEVETIANRKKHCFSLDYIDIAQEKNLVNADHSEKAYENPIEYITRLHSHIKSDIFEVFLYSADKRREQLGEVVDDIDKEYKKAVCALRKIYSNHMRLLFSLDSLYQKTLSHLMNNQSVRIMGKNIAEKIAYLQVSFRLFAQIAMPSEQREKICDKAEASLIAAYQSQLGAAQPRDILEKYILSLLNARRCARIRGENSGCDDICAWYDPSSKMFLIPAKTYFSDLKKSFPMADANKRDFETELARGNILHTVRRERQVRRTFEVVVQKDRGKKSVLKIYAASLSERFSKSSREHLERLEQDDAPYRSCTDCATPDRNIK